MVEKQDFPLKYVKIEVDELLRGDIVLHESQLWQCVIKNTHLFLNIDSKEQKQIVQSWFFKVSKLELIPQEWKYNDGSIGLKGRELGLGPFHDITIEGMRKFEQMEIIKKQSQKGRKIEYKVVLLQTQTPKKYLVIGIQFL